ncbi:hypothetical protein VTK73DRAFT_9154 [Phialemonium thermophilum]|uniref:Uncharacterized protein n=1 Tax=Phialemonium thermophilum TaxID=223376 RepID=A0ABR3XMY5_9PEZI
MIQGPDRIWRTDIKPYNQVLALTQHMINEGMDNLYKRLETGEDGLVMPEPACCYYDEHTFIDGVVFGPPSVIIDADYANVKSLQLRILMKEGRLQLRKFNGIDPKTKRPSADVFNMVIDDWAVTVPVDVGFTRLDTETKRGKAVKERSAAKGKPDHSIYELLLDLSSMSLGNAKWSFGDWHEDDWCVNELQKKTRPAGWELGQPRNFVKLDESFQRSMEF